MTRVRVHAGQISMSNTRFSRIANHKGIAAASDIDLISHVVGIALGSQFERGPDWATGPQDGHEVIPMAMHWGVGYECAPTL